MDEAALLRAGRVRIDWLREEYGADDIDYLTFAPLVELLEARLIIDELELPDDD